MAEPLSRALWQLRLGAEGQRAGCHLRHLHALDLMMAGPYITNRTLVLFICK